MANAQGLFHWFYERISNYNLFAPEIDVNDNDVYQPAMVLKRQRYATWFYILLLIVSIYVVFFIALVTPHTETINISNLTPDKFHQLHLEHTESLSCPCSTISIPYKTFVTNTMKFHPICSSLFVSEEWIDALYLFDASEYNALDFRKTAHSQFKLLAKFCSLSKELLTENQLNLDHYEFVSVNLIPEERVRSEIMAIVELLKNNNIVRILSFIDYLRIITRTNYFISALNTNLVISISDDSENYPPIGGWMQFYNDPEKESQAETTCGNANPIRSAGFYDPANSWFAGLNLVTMELMSYGMVKGFYAGCTPLEALLPSTLDCLYDIQCLQSLLNFFPTLKQMNLTWNDSVLSGKPENISLNDHLVDLFLEEWLTTMNYSLYVNKCAPSSCTYITMIKTNFIYALTLLISLYGGLILIFRLFASMIVNLTLKFKHRTRNIPLNSRYLKTRTHKLTTTIKQLNLFPVENERTEENIKQQRITTRVYLILLLGAFVILILFTSMRTQTTTIRVSNPSLNTFNALQIAHPNALKCNCSTMTIPYRIFLTLSPILHQVCSSDFVSKDWISILMSIIRQSTSIDWRNQAGPQFQLLSDLCHLAERTVEDASERFLGQSFITSNVLMKSEFDRQLNATLDQFFQSTMIHFSQLVDIVDLRMEVDQPLVQLGPLAQTSLSNIFVVSINDETNGEQSIKFKYSFSRTRDINTTSINCICSINRHCHSLVGIYNDEEFQSPHLDYTLPGSMSGCFVIDSLMLSTLQCFYSHSNCLSIVNSYIQETYYHFTDNPQWIDVQPLVYDPKLNHFAPNASIESIVKEMMIEKWNSSISYDRYYESCASNYCSYSERIPAKTLIEIIVSLISMIGGLCTSLNIITPYIVQLVRYLIKWVRQRHQQQRDNCEFDIDLVEEEY